ncbi:hypothetical protein ACMBCN_02930 [Candidatus Liberibacter asiaticus]
MLYRISETLCKKTLCVSLQRKRQRRREKERERKEKKRKENCVY